ncbi:chloride channel protein, partial [Klebsiella pneumoniae]
PDFEVGTVPTPQLALLPLFVVFGILTGLLGIAYNRLILGLLDVVARLDRIPPTVIAATIGAVIGLTLFLDPLASGGGDVLAQMIV